jgi:hypothetical protein
MANERCLLLASLSIVQSFVGDCLLPANEATPDDDACDHNDDDDHDDDWDDDAR